MPSLGRIGISKTPPVLPGGGQCPMFPSPDSRLKIQFYDWDEFHMGAYAWRLRLLAGEQDISHRHSLLNSVQWHCPEHYQPWCSNPPQLLLLSWKPDASLYDIESMKNTQLQIEGYAQSALASKALPRLLIQTHLGGWLLDNEGRIVTPLPLKAVGREKFLFDWFDEAGCFFSVGRENPNESARIEFFDAASGKTCGAYDLDNEELLPYPASKYRSIPRNAFSLLLSKSTRCVGSFLDVWTRIYFEDSRRLLQLETYRPTAEPFHSDGGLLCNAEPRWVEIELIP
jgi:hypothetical protein